LSQGPTKSPPVCLAQLSKTPVINLRFAISAVNSLKIGDYA